MITTPQNPLLKDSGKTKIIAGGLAVFSFLIMFAILQTLPPNLLDPDYQFLYFLLMGLTPLLILVYFLHTWRKRKNAPAESEKRPPNRLAHTRNLLPEHRPSTKLQTLAEKTRPRCRPSTALLPRSYRHNHRSLPRRGYADFAQNQCAAGESGDFICLHALPYPPLSLVGLRGAKNSWPASTSASRAARPFLKRSAASPAFFRPFMPIQLKSAKTAASSPKPSKL